MLANSPTWLVVLLTVIPAVVYALYVLKPLFSGARSHTADSQKLIDLFHEFKVIFEQHSMDFEYHTKDDAEHFKDLRERLERMEKYLDRLLDRSDHR